MKKDKVNSAVQNAVKMEAQGFNEKPGQRVETVITNCEFNAIKWDAKSIEALKDLTAILKLDAEAAQARTETVGSMVRLFRSQDLHIDSMLYVGDRNDVTVKDSKFDGSV